MSLLGKITPFFTPEKSEGIIWCNKCHFLYTPENAWRINCVILESPMACLRWGGGGQRGSFGLRERSTNKSIRRKDTKSLRKYGSGKKRHIIWREIPGTLAGCSRDTRRENMGSSIEQPTEKGVAALGHPAVQEAFRNFVWLFSCAFSTHQERAPPQSEDLLEFQAS